MLCVVGRRGSRGRDSGQADGLWREVRPESIRKVLHAGRGVGAAQTCAVRRGRATPGGGRAVGERATRRRPRGQCGAPRRATSRSTSMTSQGWRSPTK
eukprot:5161040-Pleurochrysis_carterae.AAC.1